MKVYLVKAENEWAEDGYEIIGVALSIERAREMQKRYLDQDPLGRMEECIIVEIEADKFYEYQDEMPYVG